MAGIQNIERSLFRNLVTALLEHGRIETTLMKAKEIGPIAEDDTIGKRGNLNDRRLALAYIKSEAVVRRLFEFYLHIFLTGQAAIQGL